MSALRQSMQGLADVILLFHAFTGCDTTSAPYMRGKVKSWKTFKNCSADLLESFRSAFYEKNSEKEDVVEAGEKLMFLLYNCPESVLTLGDLRFHRYRGTEK